MQKIMIILGTTRPGRNGAKINEWFERMTKQHEDIEFEFVDLADVNLPLLDEPQVAASGIYEHEHTKKWSSQVSGADGFIVITPEYNHGYPAVLKNAIDFLYNEWAKKPIGFVSYGAQMGVRSVEQLRLVAIHTKMVPVQEQVAIPIFNQMDENGNFLNNENDDRHAHGLIDSVKWWTKLLAEARAKET